MTTRKQTETTIEIPKNDCQTIKWQKNIIKMAKQ